MDGAGKGWHAVVHGGVFEVAVTHADSVAGKPQTNNAIRSQQRPC